MNDGFVIDTNVLVSALLKPGSTPLLAVHRAVLGGPLLFTTETWAELVEVIYRPQFDRYITGSERSLFLDFLGEWRLTVKPGESIAACRDPRDDKFLEVAVNGGAGYIVTGDDDLLVLDPFRGIRILTPQAFVGALQQT